MAGVVEYAEEALRALVPWPDSGANKYTRGKLVLVAGSAAYPGAACLAARAAQRAGAGYVEVVCTPESVGAVRACAPSLVVRSWDGWCAGDALVVREGHPCACVIGPGFDVRDEQAARLALEVIARAEVPVLVDGGAITTLASEEGICAAQERARRGRVLVATPHGGEAARMARAAGVKCPDGYSGPSASDFAFVLACAYRCTVVLKGPDTFVASGSAVGDGACVGSAAAQAGGAANGDAAGGEIQAGETPGASIGMPDAPLIIAMREGTSALAKAGTGDVLAGIIGSLLAQGLCPLDAGVLGATLHARAGVAAERDFTSISVTPEDVIDALPQVFFAMR